VNARKYVYFIFHVLHIYILNMYVYISRIKHFNFVKFVL